MDQQGIWEKINIMGIERKASLITIGMSIIVLTYFIILLVL